MSYLWFFSAALFEIAGCYALWAWLRLGKSALWLLPAAASLLLFAALLTRVEAAYAGRAYAAYGGVYIVSSLIWLALIERIRPQWFDLLGGALCLLGAAVILYGPRLVHSG